MNCLARMFVRVFTLHFVEQVSFGQDEFEDLPCQAQQKTATVVRPVSRARMASFKHAFRQQCSQRSLPAVKT